MLFTEIPFVAPSPRLEISEQVIVPTKGEVPLTTGHRPLEELYYDAPVLPAEWYNPARVDFPFSNDESAVYFEATQTRSETPEYQQAKHRVAIVIGESALAANLKHIPEETILVVDSSEDMCLFMDFYVNGLRTAKTPEEWLDRVGLRDYDVSDRHSMRFAGYEVRQVAEYLELAREHPLVSQDAFEEAHALAKQKSIIPWKADITSETDM